MLGPALTWLAVVDVGIAVAASVACFAVAAVAPICVLARGAISTGAFHTFVDVNLTCLTYKRKGGKALAL